MAQQTGKKRKATPDHGPENSGRREFFRAAAAPFFLLPRHVLGAGTTAPSDRIHVALIGAGGQGKVNARALLQQPDVRIVAVADPNEQADYNRFYYKGTAGRLPVLAMIREDSQRRGIQMPCTGYVDFRELLDKEKALDAVLVATPDHAHGVVTMAALLRNKHVYTEKPLCRTIQETRKVVEAARVAKVATQMGNFGRSGEGMQLFCEWIRDGAIGPVREVHAWAAPGLAYEWKQRPRETMPVPEGLNWDLWLGPARSRPYHNAYAPVTWRLWHDFGVGSLGDYACHHLDPAFQALRLGYPSTIEAASYGAGEETYPTASLVYFDFPSRQGMPPVRVTWYDGGLAPPSPPELESLRRISRSGHGILFVGDKGKILGGGWAESPRLIPEAAMQAYRRPPKTLPRFSGHHRNWLDCIKNGQKPCASFEEVGKMVEAILMGAIAERVNEKLYWNEEQMLFTNTGTANAFLKPDFREGWTV